MNITAISNYPAPAATRGSQGLKNAERALQSALEVSAGDALAMPTVANEKWSFKAQLAAVRTGDEMKGTIIDILA